MMFQKMVIQQLKLDMSVGYTNHTDPLETYIFVDFHNENDKMTIN